MNKCMLLPLLSGSVVIKRKKTEHSQLYCKSYADLQISEVLRTFRLCSDAPVNQVFMLLFRYGHLMNKNNLVFFFNSFTVSKIPAFFY